MLAIFTQSIPFTVATSGGSNMLLQLAPLVVIFAVFYLIFILPQRKKDKKRKEMRDSLVSGDRIVTIGGIRGRVVKVHENSITIAVGRDGTKLEIMRWAVGDKDLTEAEKAAAKTAKTEEVAKKPKRIGFGAPKPAVKEEEPEEVYEEEEIYDELDEEIDEIQDEVYEAEEAEKTGR